MAQGREWDACPYYTARDLVSRCELVLCAYPYLLHPIIRHETKLGGSLSGAVVIIDEVPPA